MMPTAAEAIDQARALVLEADPQSAFGALHGALDDPGLVGDAEPFVAAMKVFEAIATEIAGPAFAAMITAVHAAPADRHALIALADACAEEQLWSPAACCLARAVAVGGVDGDLLHRQCEIWIADGRYPAACEALRGAEPLLADDPALRHRLALCELLRGDLAAARAAAERIGPGDPASPKAQMQVQIDALQRMLDRAALADSVTTLDADDLRGWHFVTCAGLLLHLSPFGFEDGMRGRYAMTQDSAVRCRQGLLRLHAVLDEWDALPEHVLLLPDRDSHILGVCAAALFGIPAQPYDAELDGLIVAYDLSTLDPSTPAAVAHHHPGQMLFAHATCWTQPPPCVPDLTTYLYQYNQAPHLGPDVPDGDAGATPSPNDDANVEVAVQTILDAIVADDSDELPHDNLEHIVAFASAVRSLASASNAAGLRGPLISPGPVHSARFT